MLDAGEDSRFDDVAPHGFVVRAGASLGLFGTAVSVPSPDRVQAAAAPAGEQAGQEILLPVRHVQRVSGLVALHQKPCLGEPILHLVPKILLDDAKMRGRNSCQALGISLNARIPAVSLWVVIELRPAVLDLPDIHSVSQNASPSGRVSSDRGSRPCAPTWARNALLVQHRGNLLGRHAIRVGTVDSPDDRRLIRHNGTVRATLIVLDHTVAIGEACHDVSRRFQARMLALANAGTDFPGLVFSQDGFHLEEQAVDRAGKSVDLYPMHVDEILERDRLSRVSSDAIDILDHEYVELARHRIALQFEKSAPVSSHPAGLGVVAIQADDLEACTLGIFSPKGKLVLGRVLRLHLGRKAPIDRRTTAGGVVLHGHASFWLQDGRASTFAARCACTLARSSTRPSRTMRATS